MRFRPGTCATDAQSWMSQEWKKNQAALVIKTIRAQETCVMKTFHEE